MVLSLLCFLPKLSIRWKPILINNYLLLYLYYSRFSIIQSFIAMWTGIWHCPCKPAAITKWCPTQRAVQHTHMQCFKTSRYHHRDKHHYHRQNRNNSVSIYWKAEKTRYRNQWNYHFYKISCSFGIVFYNFQAFFFIIHNLLSFYNSNHMNIL